MLRITFHAIALFIWPVYLHQLLDLIGSFRLVHLVSAGKASKKKNSLLITSFTCWSIIIGCGLIYLSVNVCIIFGDLCIVSSFLPPLSLSPLLRTKSPCLLFFLSLQPLLSHTVFPLLCLLLFHAVLFVFEMRWEDRQPQRGYCVFAVCGNVLLCVIVQMAQPSASRATL